MRAFRATVLFAGLSLTLLLAGCNRTLQPLPAGQQKLVLGGGKTGSDGLTVSSPNLVAHEAQPAVIFGWQELPGESRQLTYVFVVRYPSPAPSSLGLKATSSTSAGKGRSSGQLQIANEAAAFVYSVTASPIEESLEINGRNQNLAKGRVFLIEFANGPMDVTQLDVSLPSEVPEAQSTAEVESLAADILNHLMKHSADVVEFMGRD